jgi:hypothetical protein
MFALCYKVAFTATASDNDGIAALCATSLDFHKAKVDKVCHFVRSTLHIARRNRSHATAQHFHLTAYRHSGSCQEN